MSNYEVAELMWENGQPCMNALSGFIHSSPTIWEGRAGETLECIVQQATWQNTSGEKRAESSSGQKRTRSESNCVKGAMEVTRSATISDIETWWANSLDSTPSPSLKKNFTYGVSVSSGRSGNQNEDGETKTETEKTRSGSGSSRRSRAAAVHNQSERRRRDRINQKMKALQKLVPNANKRDKASMLDEVIEYLKQLQAQVQLMTHCNSTRMNMNMNMNTMMLRLSLLSNSTTPFLSPPSPFSLPSSAIIQPHPPSQSMDMDMEMEMYKKVAQVYLQQSTQGTTNH